MKRITQNEQFRRLLKQRGSSGVNSWEGLRMEYKQMSRIVGDLVKDGCIIRRDDKKDGSVTYVLVDTPADLQRLGVDFTYEIIDGIAIKKYL